MKSKVIALSAISAALVTVFLTLGAYIEIIDLFAVVIASVFPMLPLYLKSYTGSILSFLAGGIIAFIFSGFNYLSIVFPAYFGFLGLYAIIKCKLMDKNTNRVFSVVIGLIWCVLSFYGAYYFYVFVVNGVFDGLPEIVLDYIVYFVGIIAVIFFFVFDRFILVIRIFLDKYLSRIIK